MSSWWWLKVNSFDCFCEISGQDGTVSGCVLSDLSGPVWYCIIIIILVSLLGGYANRIRALRSLVLVFSLLLNKMCCHRLVGRSYRYSCVALVVNRKTLV